MHIVFAYLWTESYATGWALYYKRMPCPTPVLLSATQILNISLNQTISLDMASNCTTSGWPLQLYVDEQEGNRFRCPIKYGKNPIKYCGEEWTLHQDPQLTMMEHWKQGNNKTSPDDLTEIQHRLLWKLYQLDTCLICRDEFKLPNGAPDSRALFKHHEDTHPDEANLSTVEGFILHVRKNPNGVKLNTPQYWEETCKLIYEHIGCSLSLGPKNLYGLLRDFMGLPKESDIPDRMFRNFFLTKPPSGSFRSDYYPIHPKDFLNDVPYDPSTARFKEEYWREIGRDLHDSYCSGSI